MNLLHISVAGITDKFYFPFLSMLKERLEAEQTIFIPYQEDNIIEKDMKIIEDYNSIGVNTIALPIKTSWDRIFYFKKIKKYARNLENRIFVNDFQIIHTHSLFSDGGVAYLLKKKYNIPYIVAVRTTDIYIFMKYFPHLIRFGQKVIEAAEKVIFITPSLKDSTINRLYKGYSESLPKDKWEIIPNGIGEFWINNRVVRSKTLKNKEILNLVQVSRLNVQKNVDKTILAVHILVSRGFNVKLDILGEGEQRNKLEKMVDSLNLRKNIYFHGFVNDLEQMKKFYAKNDIFVMPSKGETFGITYIEALSQGLPIIGINGTGVSGFFENNSVGVFINNATPSLIANAVEMIANNYDSMSLKGINSIENFDWRLVIKKYEEIYKKISEDNIN